ncbi:MAG: RNA polymerase sigma factor [Bacteroidota bacterium]
MPDFADLLAPHYSDLVQYCQALAHRHARVEAEDLVQDTLLRGLGKFAALRDRARFRPWIFQIATRTFASQARRTFWQRFVPLSTVVHLPAIHTLGVFDADQEHLLAALGQLPKKQRIALLLFELGGFSLDEIRQIQGDRSLSAVKSRLARGRSAMRTLLDDRALPSVEANSLLDEALRHTQDAHQRLTHARPAEDHQP